MKYEFKCADYADSGFEVLVRSEEVFLPDLVRHFEYFLKGCGFVLDGKHLEIVDDEETCPAIQEFLDNNQDLMDTLAKHEAESETLQQVQHDETPGGV